jgi:hypothetical protein
MQEPRDKGAYRLAVGAIGLALVVALAGICMILAVGPSECHSDCSSSSAEIPSELWKIVSALGGGLLGILAPPPTKRSKGNRKKQAAAQTAKAADKSPPGESWPEIVSKEARGNLTVLALLAIFALSAVFGIIATSNELQSLAAASGAALLGLLAPTPAHVESEQTDSSEIES